MLTADCFHLSFPPAAPPSLRPGCAATPVLAVQGSAARCSESAASIRQQLAKGVSTRLLLPPLLGHLEPATEVRRCSRRWGPVLLC